MTSYVSYPILQRLASKALSHYPIISLSNYLKRILSHNSATRLKGIITLSHYLIITLLQVIIHNLQNLFANFNSVGGYAFKGFVQGFFGQQHALVLELLRLTR